MLRIMGTDHAHQQRITVSLHGAMGVGTVKREAIKQQHITGVEHGGEHPETTMPFGHAALKALHPAPLIAKHPFKLPHRRLQQAQAGAGCSCAILKHGH